MFTNLTDRVRNRNVTTYATQQLRKQTTTCQKNAGRKTKGNKRAFVVSFHFYVQKIQKTVFSKYYFYYLHTHSEKINLVLKCKEIIPGEKRSDSTGRCYGGSLWGAGHVLFPDQAVSTRLATLYL